MLQRLQKTLQVFAQANTGNTSENLLLNEN